MNKKLSSRLTKSVKRRFNLHFSPIFRDVNQDINIFDLDKRICICEKTRFVLVRIPKCANSTVLKTFLDYDPHFSKVKEHGYSLRKAKRNAYSRPSDLPIWKQRRALKTFFAIVFVRNPFARLVSVYLDKIERNKSEKLLVANGLELAPDESIGFEGFLYYLENGGLYANPHWMPQTDCIPFPVDRVDFLGRVENLEHDLQKCVMRTFEVPWSGIGNSIGHATGANEKVRTFLSEPSIVKRVVSLYEADFSILNYSNDPLVLHAIEKS